MFGDGLRLGERRFGRLQFHFERRRVEAIEHVALRDNAALGKPALDDDAGHPRPDLGNPCWRDPAGKFAHQRPSRRLHGDDAYVHSLALGRSGRTLAARLQAESQRQGAKGRPDAALQNDHSKPLPTP